MSMEKNAALSDEMMAQASGGMVYVDPFGYVCEGTIVSGSTSPSDNTMYSVEGDNGKSYWGVWRYGSTLSAGDIVQIIHDEDGTYVLEPLQD